jgi:hypothetical protein
MSGFNKDFLGEKITEALDIDKSLADPKDILKQNIKLADGVIQGLRFSETNPTSGQALVWNDTTSLWTPATISAGESGEANTASNLGTGVDGEGLFSNKLGVDLQFKRIKAGTNITFNSQPNYVEISASVGPHTHDASDITSGTFADARIASSNVTQYESSINHNVLLNYNITEHRIINDGGTSATELWSASKINTELSGKSNTSHTHTHSSTTGQTANDHHNQQHAIDGSDHTGTLDHSEINDNEPTKHRLINDSGTSSTELWSASKISTELSNKSNINHIHSASEISTTDTGVSVQDALDNISAQPQAIGDLTDVDTTSTGNIPEIGNRLEFDGINWIPVEGLNIGDHLVSNETPSGVKNGVNKIFNTAYDYLSNQLNIYINGLRVSPIDAYTETGSNEITFVDAPEITDDIRIDYIKSTLTAENNTISNERLGEETGGIDGIIDTFTTDFNFKVNTTKVYLNGVRQILNDAYVESGINQIVFSEAPTVNDVILIDYVLN